MREDRADDQRVMRLKASFERYFERGDLGTQLAVREVGEYLGIGRAGDERVEHRAAGLAEDVRGDAVQLDAGVLQGLVQAVGLALALGDLRLAIPRKRP